jgi:hypothetical protein
VNSKKSVGVGKFKAVKNVSVVTFQFRMILTSFHTLFAALLRTGFHTSLFDWQDVKA